MRALLRLHAFAFGDAVRRLAAQPVAAVTSVLVLGLALALPVIGAMLLRSVSAATAQLDMDPHVNVYLTVDATDDDAKRVGDALRASPDAASVRFIPRAQALEELRASTHLAEILASLEKNPLPHAFTVRVRSAEPARLQTLKAEWSQLAKVDQVVAEFEWSDRLGRWLRFGERLVTVLAVLLGISVLFIVGHLIRLQVVTRRDEIEVSQLIGATAPDVRRPFLYHGAVQGLFAGTVAVATAAALGAWLGAEVRALTPNYASDFKLLFLPIDLNLWMILGTALLGLFGAWLAVDRELQRFAHR
jgi:cell division transport system permease protein